MTTPSPIRSAAQPRLARRESVAWLGRAGFFAGESPAPGRPLRPVLKWAGAKRKLVSHISPWAPPTARRLIEPFLGSAAVALNLGFAQNLLADSNPDVIGLYRCLGEDAVRFENECRQLFVPANNNAEAYYRLREEFNATTEAWRRSVLFVYLNRHGYNGLCRYNNKGRFNVPFGRYDAPRFPAEEFAQMAGLLARSELRCEDFKTVMREAGAGDFVYCDPPYSPASDTANFTSYAKGGFSHADQLDLVAAAVEAAARGAVVAISNHDTPVTRALYEGATHTIELRVPRLISCDGGSRHRAAELLVVYAAEPVMVAL